MSSIPKLIPLSIPGVLKALKPERRACNCGFCWLCTHQQSPRHQKRKSSLASRKSIRWKWWDPIEMCLPAQSHLLHNLDCSVMWDLSSISSSRFFFVEPHLSNPPFVSWLPLVNGWHYRHLTEGCINILDLQTTPGTKGAVWTCNHKQFQFLSYETQLRLPLSEWQKSRKKYMLLTVLTRSIQETLQAWQSA